jgi:hypothetical protein
VQAWRKPGRVGCGLDVEDNGVGGYLADSPAQISSVNQHDLRLFPLKQGRQLRPFCLDDFIRPLRCKQAAGQTRH